jgi:hypothetical protein
MEPDARCEADYDAGDDGQEVIAPADRDPGLAALPWLDVS